MSLHDLESLLLTSSAERSVPGVAVSVVESGEGVSTCCSGVRSEDSGDPVMPRTVFEAASMGKAVTAYLALRLAGDGLLDLDEPLAGYLDDYLSGDSRMEIVTARLALTHRSGLWRDDWRSPPYFEQDPGGPFKYSNEGIYALQLALEGLTGMGLQDMAERYVFDPHGMASSSFVWREDYDVVAALDHDAQGLPLQKWKPHRPLAPTSLHSTAPDFARFLAGALAPERRPGVLGPQWVATMLRPHVEVHEVWGGGPPEPGSCWGLGWGVQTGAPVSFWHWGWNDGFQSFAVGWPSQARGVVILTNGSGGLWVCKDVVTWFSGRVHPAFRWLEH